MPATVVRQLVSQVVKHGRQVLEGFVQKGQVGGKAVPRVAELKTHPRHKALVKTAIKPPSWLSQQLGGRSYLAPAAAELRHRVCQHLLGGTASIASRGALGARWYNTSGRLSLYAFLGVGLAGGFSAEDEAALDRGYDNVCANIRTIFQQKQQEQHQQETFTHVDQFDDLQFGPRIAISCSAAVYNARPKTTYDDDSDMSIISEDESDKNEDEDTEAESIISSSSWEQLDSEGEEQEEDEESQDEDISIISYNSDEAENNRTSLNHDHDYPLAVKMMFNYASSRTSDIYQQMSAELLPLATPGGDTGMLQWENGNHARKKALPPHPNIIRMHQAFVDEVPCLPGAVQLYPDALPFRLHPGGCGRNKTLFLIMDRYEWTLREYVRHHQLTLTEGLLLLGQLLEAVVHMNHSDVAHRDLKSDNILIRERSDGCHLVVTDFGSSLSGEGLCLDFSSKWLSRGGNAALMAPEIANAVPGERSKLDFRKSDLWAVGTIAYEIFGNDNPFYDHLLDNRYYEDCDIPDVQGVPHILNSLIKSLLSKNPAQRPDPSLAATCVGLMLWAPQHWLVQVSAGGRAPHKVALMRWLTTFTAALLCQRETSSPELQLKSSFLSRVRYGEICQAFQLLASFSTDHGNCA